MIDQGTFLDAQIDYVISQISDFIISRDSRNIGEFYVYSELIDSEQYASDGSFSTNIDVHWQYIQDDTSEQLQDDSFDKLKSLIDLYENYRTFIQTVFCTEPKPIGDVCISYTLEGESDVIESESSNTYYKGVKVSFNIVQ